MKLAIAHYHLQPGGVTQVIANHVAALTSQSERLPEAVAILHGGDETGWRDTQTSFPLHRQAIDGLAYRESTNADPRVATAIVAVLDQLGFARDETVLHWHNDSLGKNAQVPAAVAELARQGWPQLLQIHDFAEEMRPANYVRLHRAFGPRFAESVYPQNRRTHYAVLSDQDRRTLLAAGIDQPRVHLLANPVVAPFETARAPTRDAARERLAAEFSVSESARFWVYPVRGIGRKNLGEALLIAAAGDRCVDEGLAVAITLTPKNPKELTGYRRWEAFSTEWSLPVLFGSGDPGRLSFAENLVAADAILSTSVAEGFGMVFAESWLADRPLVGRDLPGVSRDFAAAGIDLSGLYKSLEIPLDWIPPGALDQLRQEWVAAYSRVRRDYGRRPLTSVESDASWESGTSDDTIDFASLSIAVQELVIGAVVNDRERAEIVWQQVTQTDSSPIGANAAAVREHYGVAASARRLWTAYDAVRQGAASNGCFDAAAILDDPVDGKLSEANFRLLRLPSSVTASSR